MSLVLTVNPNATPVPWGSLGLASYAATIAPELQIETQYDANAKSSSLSDMKVGKIVTDSFEILSSIALSSGLSGPLALVSPPNSLFPMCMIDRPTDP